LRIGRGGDLVALGRRIFDLRRVTLWDETYSARRAMWTLAV
jgi:hypothetical protein